MSCAPKRLLNMRSRDPLIMAGSFLFFAFMLVVGVRWGIPSATGAELSLTSAAFYPYVVCWIGLVISGVATVGTAVGQHATPPAGEPSYPLAKVLLRFVVVLVIFALTYILLQRAGALLTMIVIFAGMLLLGGERRIGVVALASIGIPVAAYFIFSDLARVPLPSGILSF